jgi:hypothetical protein
MQAVALQAENMRRAVGKALCSTAGDRSRESIQLYAALQRVPELHAHLNNYRLLLIYSFEPIRISRTAKS